MGALLNALDFVDSNFEKDAERNYIMQVRPFPPRGVRESPARASPAPG